MLPDTPKCVVSLTECSVERCIVFFGKTTEDSPNIHIFCLTVCTYVHTLIM
jgi:hypothetical protein